MDPLACTTAVAGCIGPCDASNPALCGEGGCDQSTDPAFTLVEGQCVANNQCVVADANCVACDPANPAVW